MLWFDGVQTRQTGPVRNFESPALTPGQSYTYNLKAQWQENGQTVTRTKTLSVSPGQRLMVDFLNPNGNNQGQTGNNMNRVPPPASNNTNPDRGNRPPSDDNRPPR
jgi:uncharacterized protein (TIGR03000 family)